MSDLSCDFQLPEVFVQAHALELLMWARDLAKWGPALKVKLKKAPAGRQIDVVADLLPECVTLTCSLFKREVGGERRFVIAPGSAYDAEMIDIYCDKLPAIEAARERFIQAQARRRNAGAVAAEVERIPQEFVEAYREEFASWGQRFGKSFGATTIILREVPGAPVELDGWGNRPLLAVEVVAEILERGADFVKLLIKPADEQSEMRIRKHAEDIVRYGEPVARRAH